MNTKARLAFLPRMRLKHFLDSNIVVLLLWVSVTSSVAQPYTVLVNFTKTIGSWPGVTLLTTGTNIYGTSALGGSSNSGMIFKMDMSGKGYSAIKNFTNGPDGGMPLGLALSGGTLYGTTFVGGSSNLGTVFKINTDGSGYSVLKSFYGYPGDGANCNGGLVLSGSTLYGTTMYAGDYIFGGTVFKINIDGSGYQVIKNFSGDDGAYPVAGLALSGATLYGITGGGGYADHGTIFKVNTDGTGFALLKSFTWTNNDGYSPQAGLIISGSTLYGTTLWSGGSGLGTVYKVSTDGSGYTVLKQFLDGSEGANPLTALVASATTLYGTTWRGGSYDSGIAFELNKDGTGYAVLKEFDGHIGANPMVPLVLSSTTLYGMTASGGSLNGGVAFSLSISPPAILEYLASQTAELGSTVDFGLITTGSWPLCYQWIANNTNVLSNGGTNSDFILTNVQFSQSGSYVVVVSNLFGSTTSAPAMLNVTPAFERRPVPGILLAGEAGSTLNLDYASVFIPTPDWSTLDTVYFTNAPQFYFDLTDPLPPQRFYRAWQSGTPSVIPSLKLAGMVPAITLTGNVGDNLRLDYINQFGPTDAWVTLDTITLTNTTQLYFDVSTIGQPPRLWRIVPVPLPINSTKSRKIQN